jgi:hypothetical protein
VRQPAGGRRTLARAAPEEEQVPDENDAVAADPPDDDERAELERLRAEVAELRSTPSGDGDVAGGGAGGRWAGRGRWVGAAVLIGIVGVLTPVAVLARYARSEVLDTDRYVSTVAPLARDPDVQSAVADTVTERLLARLDVEDLATEALQALVDRGAPDRVVALATPLADQVGSYVGEQVTRFVQSEQFATLWEDVNRAAHTQVNALLTGEDSGALAIDEGTITLDLAPVVAAVQQRLVDRGFDLAARIPEVDAQLTLVESANLESAQRGVRLLDRLGAVLPWVVLAIAAIAVFVAPNRRRGVIAVALAALVGVVVVGLGLALARNWYVDHGQARFLTKDAALSIGQQILQPLRTSLRAVLVVAAAVALAAFVAGPSAPARAVRRAFTGGIGAGRDRLAGGREPSAVESWVAANKTALRIALVVAGAAVVALWTYPSGAVVLTIVALVILGLVVVELLGRAPATGPPTPAG